MPRTRGQRFFFGQTFSGKGRRFFFLHHGQEHRRQLFLIGPVPQAGLLLRVGEKAALQQYRPTVHMVHQIDGVRDWLALPAVQTVVPAEETLILDAGHGGEDGGAVSVTGARESDINLAVVLRLRDLLAFYGTDPVLLREEDVSLHSPGAVSPREKKTSDLKNRVQAVNHIPNATLLSIHQK